jgi:hypothetical protein
MQLFVSGLSERRVVVRPWRRSKGRRTMFDALLYCQLYCQVYSQLMADIRHGYFLMVADFVRTITAQFRPLWAGRPPIDCQPQEHWLQSLARLETYVDSMA